MTLVPFNEQLNRLRLVIKDGSAAKYKITWGEESRTYFSKQLATGINLAEDFAVNPFLEAFNKVDEAVAAKQAYETTQIKKIFHGVEGNHIQEKRLRKNVCSDYEFRSAVPCNVKKL